MPFTEERFHPENTTWGKTKAAVAGAPVRVASIIAGAPRGIGETFNTLSNAIQSGEGWLPGDQDIEQPHIPEWLLNKLPTETSLVNRLKNTPFEDILPTGALESHPFLDRPLAFAATAPLLGGGTGSYLSKMAAAYPTGLSGEASREMAEALKLSPGWQTVAEIGGGLLGGWGINKGIQTGKKILGKTTNAVENLSEQFLNKKMPLYKEAGKIASQEEIQAAQLAREESKVKLREAKIAQQKEASIKKALEKYNENQIAEKTKSDVQRLRERTQTKNALDKFYQENINQISQKDYQSLKNKIANGERIDIPKEWDSKIGFNKDILEHRNQIEGLRTSEEAMIDTAGAKPGILREHARDLYNQFEESATDSMRVSDRYIEPILQELNESIGYGIENVESKKNLSEIISGIRDKVKKGTVKVRDVAAFKKDINEKVRRWARQNGVLERFEKSAPRINKYLDSTLDLAKQEHPGIQLSKLRKADKVTAEVNTAEKINRDLKDLAESNLPFSKTRYIAKWLNNKPDIAYMFRSPNVQKFYFRAAQAWGKRNSQEAIRNLMALDKTLEHEYSKQSNLSVSETLPPNIYGTAGKFSEIR